jgi:large subunit ribosomal protein L29
MPTGQSTRLKMTELKEMTPLELKNRLQEYEDDLEALRFQLDAGQLPNTARVHHIRKDIARLKTVLREHDLGLRKPKGATS